MTKEYAEKKVTITLTDERPVVVKNGNYPVVAKATHAKDHNNQEIFRRHYLRVRQHDTGADLESFNPHEDGKCFVYGWYESSYQGENGAQAGYRCQIEDAVKTVRKVGDRIGAPEWLIDECVADLPAVEEGEPEVPVNSLLAEVIGMKRHYSELKEVHEVNGPVDGLSAKVNVLQEVIDLIIRRGESVNDDGKMSRLCDVLMQYSNGAISSGKARETLRNEGFPADVYHRVMPSPQP